MSTHTAISSAVFALSRVTWRIGDFLPALKQNSDIPDSAVGDLIAEVKSFGRRCESAHATLQERVEQKETTHSVHTVDNVLWDCIAVQVDEASRTLQELELFIQDVRGEETRRIAAGHLDKGKEMATTRTRVVRHIDDLYFTMLLTNM
jgi:hypothetical protein